MFSRIWKLVLNTSVKLKKMSVKKRSIVEFCALAQKCTIMEESAHQNSINQMIVRILTAVLQNTEVRRVWKLRCYWRWYHNLQLQWFLPLFLFSDSSTLPDGWLVLRFHFVNCQCETLGRITAWMRWNVVRFLFDLASDVTGPNSRILFMLQIVIRSNRS